MFIVYLKYLSFNNLSLQFRKIVKIFSLLFLIPIKVCLVSFPRSKSLLLVSTTILFSITTTLLKTFFGRIKSITTIPFFFNSKGVFSNFNTFLVSIYHSTNLSVLKSRLQTDNDLVNLVYSKFSIKQNNYYYYGR